MASDNNREVVAKLTQDLEEAQDENKDYKQKMRETDDIIYALRFGIQSIYSQMGLESEIIGSDGVTESNMMDYLGIIEQRTIEVLNMYEACETKADFKTSEKTNENKGEPLQKKEKEKPQIDCPDVQQTVVDTEQQPLSKTQFKEMAKELMHKPESLTPSRKPRS